MHGEPDTNYLLCCNSSNPFFIVQLVVNVYLLDKWFQDFDLKVTKRDLGNFSGVKLQD